MNIEITDYLSEQQNNDIIAQAIKDKCKVYLENNFERLLSNAAYHVVWKSVDEVIDGTFKEQLEECVQKQMSNFSEFNLFQKPDAWSRETNSAYKLLIQSVENNKHLIDGRVREVISNLKPRTKTVYEEVTEDIFDLKSDFEDGKLYYLPNKPDNYKVIDTIHILCQCASWSTPKIFRKVEKEIDWRKEVYNKFQSSGYHWSTPIGEITI